MGAIVWETIHSAEDGSMSIVPLVWKSSIYAAEKQSVRATGIALLAYRG